MYMYMYMYLYIYIHTIFSRITTELYGYPKHTILVYMLRISEYICPLQNSYTKYVQEICVLDATSYRFMQSYTCLIELSTYLLEKSVEEISQIL